MIKSIQLTFQWHQERAEADAQALSEMRQRLEQSKVATADAIKKASVIACSRREVTEMDFRPSFFLGGGGGHKLSLAAKRVVGICRDLDHGFTIAI